MLTAATLAQLAAQGAGEEIETLLPDHWFACLVNRPEKLGGPAECDCNRGKLAARIATLTAQRDEAIAAAERAAALEEAAKVCDAMAREWNLFASMAKSAAASRLAAAIRSLAPAPPEVPI